jgi:hypothetical protein
MQEKNILLCFLTLPLRHKVVAAGIAVAIASVFFLWSRHAAPPATTAAVSFDAGAAGQIEPAALQAKEPAVALARSILNDETVVGLAKRTGVNRDVAEFRSRLQVTQRSANLLDLNYRDGDREVSAATANAVANLLVAWKPSAAVAPREPALQAVPLTPPPVMNAHARRSSRGSKSDEIDALEAQLSAVNQKLAQLNASPPQASTPRKTEVAAQTSNADNEQRRVLESQLSNAQKKLDDLRLRYTDEYPDVETAKENVADLQQQIASLPPVSHEMAQTANSSKSESGSSEASQLLLERDRLVHTIAAEKGQGVTLHDQTAARNDAPAASPIRALPAPVRQPGNAMVAPILQSPFTLVRLASYNEPVSWWHGALAGILCGFLYLSSAMWRYLPIQGAAAQERFVLKGESGAAEANQANTSADFESWEKQVREAIASTDIGREEEARSAKEGRVNGSATELTYGLTSDPGNVSHNELEGHLHFHEVEEAIRAKAKREPNSWMAHTEEARAALAGGDYDTAIKEINLAITVAPEKMKPQLGKIITQLDKSMSVKPRAAFG